MKEKTSKKIDKKSTKTHTKNDEIVYISRTLFKPSFNTTKLMNICLENI